MAPCSEPLEKVQTLPVSKLCTPGSFSLQIFCSVLSASICDMLSVLLIPEYQRGCMWRLSLLTKVAQAPLESIMACIAEVEKSEVPSPFL